jgi:chemotaxis response regulator CheB
MLKMTGARTIAQDERSSAVYGMPKAAKDANAATDVLPLEKIGPFLNELLRRADRISGQQSTIPPRSDGHVR